MSPVLIIGLEDENAIRAISSIARFWGFSARPGTIHESTEKIPVILGPSTNLESIDAVGISRPVLKFSAGSVVAGGDRSPEITFSEHPAIPSFFHRRRLVIQEETFPETLASSGTLTVAATVATRPVWLVSDVGRVLTWVVACPAPSLRPNERLAQILNGETFLHALPVWLFFRALSSSDHHSHPPLRACMIVDDPNLHSATYGHLSYRSIVELARSRPFHLSVATVPLDGWATRQAVIQLFKENRDALSLIVHGNDHLHHELAGQLSQAERELLVDQALARVAAFERKTGLSIDRVMAPPHGVCSPAMMETLNDSEFEALTTNRWSLWKDSPPPQLPEYFGLFPADLLAGALPVMPRFRFNSKIATNEILLAALFGQPIIPYGHHKDFKGDMAVVQAVVDTVNSLGRVKWVSMREILRSNFEQRTEGKTLHVRLFSQQVLGQMPPDCNRLLIDAPHFDATIRLIGAAGQGEVRTISEDGLSVPGGTRFELKACKPSHGRLNQRFKFPKKAFLKRMLSEVRDRLLV